MLVGERIIVKDLAEDLYDGQVLQKLFGKKKCTCTVLRHFVNKWIFFALSKHFVLFLPRSLGIILHLCH